MNPTMQETIGLFFGSFDPVHLGHLIIADHLQSHAGLSQVWFVLSPRNPLKIDKDLSSESLRMEMLQLAISDNTHFQPCDIELNMPAPHYTGRTLKALKDQHPQKQFALIIGTDNLEVFDRWKDYTDILDNNRILVYPRPGFKGSPFASHPNVELINAPMIEISSTHIRESFLKGQPARYMLTERVYRFIVQQNLYSI